jgi:uncharacterized protein (TIGR00251 family)
MAVFSNNGDGSMLIAVKAVPGASRDQIAGVMGDRLKVRVAAPPEGGKANKAIESLLAAALGINKRDVEVVQGRASAEKTVRVAAVTAIEAGRRLGIT